ncbi:MAG: hypothetical protein ACOYYF_01935 [Chloroflexota bacterium]|nr:hypothetical protein [Chloroflexota bacterium]MBI5705161.1 hypothetical protein [Chloroflexota bacterium]
MNINFTKVIICSIAALLLFGCQPLETPPASATPLVEVQVLEPMTETPVPACVLLPDVELSVDLISEDSVHIRITGLLPNETVHAIFGSKTKDRAVETVVSGSADEKGVFEYSENLRGHETLSAFKDWQIRVVHSRGSTCTEISLPEK